MYISMIFFLFKACGGVDFSGHEEEARTRIEPIENELLDRLDHARKMRCPRKVFRGEPLPGSGSELLYQSLFPAEDNDCRLKLKPLGETARAEKRKITALEYRGVRQQCADELELLRKAVQHEELCSPVRTGVRRDENTIHSRLFIGFVASEIQHLLDKNEVGKAAELALDLIRATQDFETGTFLLVPLSNSLALHNFQPTFERLIHHPGLDRSLVSDLETLLSNERHLSSVIIADYLDSYIETVMPILYPKGWSPPGGWQNLKPPLLDSSSSTASKIKTKSIGKYTEAYLVLEFLRREFQKKTAACPEEYKLQKCIQNFEQMHKEQGLKKSNPKGSKADIYFEKQIDALTAISVPNYRTLYIRNAYRRFMLSAARINLAYAEQGCPSIEDFRKKNPGLLADPNSSGDFTIKEDSGELQLLPVMPLEIAKKNVLWTLRCPATR